MNQTNHCNSNEGIIGGATEGEKFQSLRGQRQTMSVAGERVRGERERKTRLHIYCPSLFTTPLEEASHQLIVVLRRDVFSNLPLFVSASNRGRGLVLKR